MVACFWASQASGMQTRLVWLPAEPGLRDARLATQPHSHDARKSALSPEPGSGDAIGEQKRAGKDLVPVRAEQPNKISDEPDYKSACNQTLASCMCLACPMGVWFWNADQALAIREPIRPQAFAAGFYGETWEVRISPPRNKPNGDQSIPP